jgi:hypothetical protein
VDHDKLKTCTTNPKATTKTTKHRILASKPTKETKRNFKKYSVQKKADGTKRKHRLKHRDTNKDTESSGQIKRQRLSEKKKHYATYEKPTLNIKTQTDQKEKAENR